MRIAFFGLPIAALSLARDGHRLSLVVLSPVEHPGRRRIRSLLPRDRIVDTLDCAANWASRVEDVLASDRPGLLVSWYWTRRLPKKWLDLPETGAIGVHASLLPRHRGPNPFFWSIDCGDHWTGVTVHRLTPEYDEGDILLSERVEVGPRDSWQLARALDRPSLRLLRRAVACMSRGESLAPVPQDEALASWAPEPRGAALRVDWRWSSERVLRRIRALAPVPGLAIRIRELPIFVTRAEHAQDCPAALEAGEAAVLGDPPTVVVIRTGDGAISVERAVAGLGSDLEPGVDIGSKELALLVARRRGVLDFRTRRSE